MSSSLPYTLVLKLSKREPSGHPRLKGDNFTYFTYLHIRFSTVGSNARRGYLYFPYHKYFREKFDPNYSPSSNGQIVRQTDLFNLGMVTSPKKGKLWIQIC